MSDKDYDTPTFCDIQDMVRRDFMEFAIEWKRKKEKERKAEEMAKEQADG